MSSKSRRLVFTLNNYTSDEEQKVADHLDSDLVKYGIYGRETGAEGTPHLQGFVIYPQPQRFSYFHRLACARAHLEVARAKSANAADYCKKEGDFEEFGELPDAQGKRSDIDNFKEWVSNLTTPPSEREIARAFPALFLRYRQNLMDLGRHLGPEPIFGLGDGNLRGWQRELEQSLEEDPDDRTVQFLLDPDGGSGKTWFVKYWLEKHPTHTQVLSIGKRDDLAHAVDPSKTIFLFDIPRGGMEYLQYSVLEKLKDGIIFSGKYASMAKILPNKVHVIVFCNERPDVLALTHDRYKITELS